MDTDASNTGIGGVLSQLGEDGRERVSQMAVDYCRNRSGSIVSPEESC